MKRKERREFDQIVERYLPRTSDEEAESARDRLFQVLRHRHLLQEAIDNFKVPQAITKLVSLSYVDQLVLTSTYLLHGEESSSLAIADKVHELSAREIDEGAIFVSLDRLERGGLISARPFEEPPEGYKAVLVFQITEDGKSLLPDIVTGARRLVDALKDFASPKIEGE